MLCRRERAAMILLIDNYDSFVFNLARYVRELGGEVAVVRNDAVSLGEIQEKKPAGIIMSAWGPHSSRGRDLMLRTPSRWSADRRS